MYEQQVHIGKFYIDVAWSSIGQSHAKISSQWCVSSISFQGGFCWHNFMHKELMEFANKDCQLQILGEISTQSCHHLLSIHNF
jgi:hypothetical protein